MSRTAMLALIACAAVTLHACSGLDESGLRSPSASISRVVIGADDVSLRVGQAMQLTATAEDSSGRRINGAEITWSTADPAVASITREGRLLALAAGTTTALATGRRATAQVQIRALPGADGAIVNVLRGQTFQTITGWEATVQIGEPECKPAAIAALRTAILDRAVNELGLNRVRLQIISGTENPVDYFGRMLAGTSTTDQYRQHRYEIINDNKDPNVIDPAGFQFRFLDFGIESVVRPLQQRLAARGERLYVNLNYGDFKSSDFEHHEHPEEYAEYMYAVFDHMQKKYGFVPDAVEIILEPDKSRWPAADIGRVIVATGDRLKAAGWRPAFIAPSTASTAKAVSYAKEIVAQPRVREYLTDLAYHRYRGDSPANIQSIARIAARNGLRTAMLEKIGAGYEKLHQDLVEGNVSAWQQYTIAFCSRDNGGHYYTIDQDAVPPLLQMGEQTKFLRQYFLFVRQNAVRVGATSSSPLLDPLAFRNTNGTHVVVVKAAQGASFAVAGLPAGTYGIKFTTNTQYDVDLPDVTIAAGGMVSASVPATGVITVYQR